jgi:hypothetical protein
MGCRATDSVVDGVSYGRYGRHDECSRRKRFGGRCRVVPILWSLSSQQRRYGGRCHVVRDNECERRVRLTVCWSVDSADAATTTTTSAIDTQSCSSSIATNRLSYSIQIGRSVVDSVFDLQFNLDRVGGSVTGAMGLQKLLHGPNFTSVIYSHSQQKTILVPHNYCIMRCSFVTWSALTVKGESETCLMPVR